MEARVEVRDLQATADAAEGAALRRELCFRSFFLCTILVIFFPDSLLGFFCVVAGFLALCLGIKFDREASAYQRQLDEAALEAAAVQLARIRNRTVLVAEPAPAGAVMAPENRNNVAIGMAIQREGTGNSNSNSSNANGTSKSACGEADDAQVEKYDGDAVYGRAQYTSEGGYAARASSPTTAAPDLARQDYIVVQDGEDDERQRGNESAKREEEENTGGAASGSSVSPSSSAKQPPQQQPTEESTTSPSSSLRMPGNREREETGDHVEVEVADPCHTTPHHGAV